MQKNFSPTDIKWIKSVTRDNGQSWAYLNQRVGDTFDLNFSKNPKWYPTNYSKAKSKEIIVLFQTYQENWYVTHLVSPIGSEIGVSNNPTHPYTRMVTIVGINNDPTPINQKDWSFFKCNRGQICNIKTIERKKGADYSIENKQKFVWNLFEELDQNLIQEIPSTDNDLNDDGLEVMEGKERTILKLHRYKERDPKIITAAKNQARQENRFYCEACDFNFETRYPQLGSDFIECHHKTPIATGGIRKTKVGDLALVCSNCHRMLHRKMNGEYLSVEQLRVLIKKVTR